jgi:hypothetical protein
VEANLTIDFSALTSTKRSGRALSLLLSPKIMTTLIRFAFTFEPLIPFLSYVLLRIEFLRLRKAGYVIAYSIKTGRLAKYYYEFNIHIVLDPKRVRSMMKEQVSKFMQDTLSGALSTNV